MKIKIWPKDAKGAMEKITYVLAFVMVPALYLFMQLSAWGIFHNFYSVACKSAGWGWKIPGLLFTAALVYSVYEAAEDRSEKYDPSAIYLFVLLVASIGFYCGFGYPYIF